jgi:hypothetical protein
MMKRTAVLAALAVACTTSSNPDGGSPGNSYTVGGSVGSNAVGLVLTATPAPNTVTITAGETSYTFPNTLQSGTAYDVTVMTQPSGATCTVANPQGVVGSANVTNVNISCVTHSNSCATPPCYTISLYIMNAGASGLVVADPGQPNLTVPSSYSPVVPFANQVSNGTAFDVTILSQPPAGTGGQATCAVETGGSYPGTGTVNGANVEVGITCAIALP